MGHVEKCACAALVAGVFVLGACGEKDTVPPEIRMMRALKNMEYRTNLVSDGVAEVVDGVYEEPATPDSAAKVRVAVTQWLAVEDLDGDGRVDGAAVLASQGGGSGTFLDLVAVVGTREGPEHVATVPLGDRVGIEALRISQGWVIVDLLAHTPEDPMAAPSDPVRQTYRLVDRELILSD